MPPACFPIVKKFELICTVRSKLTKFKHVRSDRGQRLYREGPGPRTGTSPYPYCEQTDTTENITFPQFCWRAVNEFIGMHYIFTDLLLWFCELLLYFHGSFKFHKFELIVGVITSQIVGFCHRNEFPYNRLDTLPALTFFSVAHTL